MKRIADVLTVLAALIVLGGYDLLRLLTGFLWQADNGKPGILARFINATAGAAIVALKRMLADFERRI